MRVKQSNGTSQFRTLSPINFAFSSSADSTEVTIYDSDTSTKLPTYFLLKKQVSAISGEVKTATFTFNSTVAYD
jgi:hypothetical protein